jgi:hypothetical protein
MRTTTPRRWHASTAAAISLHVIVKRAMSSDLLVPAKYFRNLCPERNL